MVQVLRESVAGHKNICQPFSTVAVWIALLIFHKSKLKKPCVKLAQKEGISAGTSSGGAVWASIKLAEEHPDAVIVCIICDRGDRYLSTGLFSVQDPG